MKYQCEMVQDLLPLYQDHICSDASKQIVEQHLHECERCSQSIKLLRDASLESQLYEECGHVLSAHRKSENRRTLTIGIVTGGILMIPVVVCLICNIAIGHGLDWFFIVLTAILLAASLLVVPMVAAEKKLLWTLLSSTCALLALLLTCCIYTGGSWFFVAAVSCLFGISLIFAPYVIREIALPQKLQKHKALLVYLWDSLWLYLLLIVCGIFVQGGQVYWKVSLAVATYYVILVFLWVMVLRYLRWNGWTKAGVLSILSGIWGGITNNVIEYFLPSANGGLEHVDLSQGFSLLDADAFQANINLTVILVSILAGIVCLIVGIGKGKAKKE